MLLFVIGQVGPTAVHLRMKIATTGPGSLPLARCSLEPIPSPLPDTLNALSTRSPHHSDFIREDDSVE